MANIFILVSSFVGAAIAAPSAPLGNKWFNRVFKSRKPNNVVADRPFLHRETGWQLIQCDDAEEFGRWLDKDQVGMPPTDGEEPSLGSHLLIEMFDCDPESIKGEFSVGHAMRDAAVKSEATVVTESFHEFKPYGVSGAVIIQESHYTIHTWPEHGYAAVDLFYCGGSINVHKALDVLRAQFKPERMKFLVVRRGIQSEVVR